MSSQTPKARNIIFRAKELKTGRQIMGYYAVLHLPKFDKVDQDKVVGYEEKYCIFNDRDKSQGGYWHDIDIDTLEMIQQTELF